MVEAEAGRVKFVASKGCARVAIHDPSRSGGLSARK
jgi:hypothetical protein